MAGYNEDNIFLISDFDDPLEQVMVPLMKQVKEESEKVDGEINLWINSYGGFSHIVMQLVELVEVAKRQGVTVRTIVPSVAFSAGSMLAVAGTPGERYIAKHAEHLVHYGSVGSLESTPTQIERWRAWKDRGFKHTITHYKHYCDIPDLEEKIADDGYFVPAKDCIKWKLADKYLDKLEL